MAKEFKNKFKSDIESKYKQGGLMSMMPTKKQEVSVPSQFGLPQSGTDEYSDDQRDLKMPIGKKE